MGELKYLGPGTETRFAFQDAEGPRTSPRNPNVPFTSFHRWRLQKAFYHPDGLGTAGCSGIGMQDICPAWLACQSRCNHHHVYDNLFGEGRAETETRSLSLAGLKDTKPEYVSNIVVNRWRLSDESEESYGLLTMSSTGIDRLDRTQEPDPFMGRLGPADIKLSEAMATSGAALSQHMGKYDNTVEGVIRFYTLLGLEMGATMISDYRAVRHESIVFRVCYLIYYQCIVLASLSSFRLLRLL